MGLALPKETAAFSLRILPVLTPAENRANSAGRYWPYFRPALTLLASLCDVIKDMVMAYK